MIWYPKATGYSIQAFLLGPKSGCEDFFWLSSSWILNYTLSHCVAQCPAVQECMDKKGPAIESVSGKQRRAQK